MKQVEQVKYKKVKAWGDRSPFRMRFLRLRSGITLCVGASAGGHLNQLIKLLELQESWPVAPDLCVTTVSEVACKLQKRYAKTEVVGECNREVPLQIARVVLRTLVVALKYRPRVIISTGSLPIAILCLWGKLMGSRIVWIDSIANVRSLSMSGQMTYRFADLFIVQWEALKAKYPKATYVGQLL